MIIWWDICLELTSGDAEFQNEILHVTWSSIISLIFAPAPSMRGGKTHWPWLLSLTLTFDSIQTRKTRLNNIEKALKQHEIMIIFNTVKIVAHQKTQHLVANFSIRPPIVLTYNFILAVHRATENNLWMCTYTLYAVPYVYPNMCIFLQVYNNVALNIVCTCACMPVPLLVCLRQECIQNNAVRRAIQINLCTI